jgi:hypothetical protein
MGLTAGLPDLALYGNLDGSPFTGFMEVKAAKGRATEAQARFLTNVREAGGIAALVRSAEDAQRALHGVD